MWTNKGAFPTEMKPRKFMQGKNSQKKKSEGRGEERKRKVNVETAVSLLNKTQYCFLS